MKLTYNKTVVQLNQDETLFHTIFETVNELITSNELIFSHLVIDGVEVFENHEQYIQNRVGSIKEIQIITRTTGEIIEDILQEIYDYLERAIPAIDELVSESFSGFTDKTWSNIAQLTEGMQWMLQFMDVLRNTDQKPQNWQSIDEEFKHCEKQFELLLGAIEANDTLHISDILSYEIIPAYEQFQLCVKETIDQGLIN